MASFAHQTTLSGMSDKFNGRTPVRIYFLDNSSKLLLLESETTAGDLISMLLKKCGVVEVIINIYLIIYKYFMNLYFNIFL